MVEGTGLLTQGQLNRDQFVAYSEPTQHLPSSVHHTSLPAFRARLDGGLEVSVFVVD